MVEAVHPLAGKPVPDEMIPNIPQLVSAYYTHHPDPDDPGQQVSFGTSGHRGVSFQATFNEAHVLATTQAVCELRRARGVDGPLYVGMDTHALSEPAFASLAATQNIFSPPINHGMYFCFCASVPAMIIGVPHRDMAPTDEASS